MKTQISFQKAQMLTSTIKDFRKSQDDTAVIAMVSSEFIPMIVDILCVLAD